MMNTRPAIIPLMACLLLMVSALALATPAPAAEPTLEIRGGLTTGSDVRVVYDLKGYAISTGSYASINVRTLAAPSGATPKVKPGYPVTVLTFDAPGTYELRFILNEVSKPSCGGVDARQLLDVTRTLTIAAP